MLNTEKKKEINMIRYKSNASNLSFHFNMATRNRLV